jgi:hypothetical protein
MRTLIENIRMPEDEFVPLMANFQVWLIALI